MGLLSGENLSHTLPHDFTHLSNSIEGRHNTGRNVQVSYTGGNGDGKRERVMTKAHFGSTGSPLLLAWLRGDKWRQDQVGTSENEVPIVIARIRVYKDGLLVCQKCWCHLKMHVDNNG